MTLKVLQMIKRLCFSILLVMLATLTPVYAFQESDLTTKAPPCKGKVSGPLKDNRGFSIPNPRWVDIKGNGICEVIGSEGSFLNSTIIADPNFYYFKKNGGYESFPRFGSKILAIYYLKNGGAPYFVEQGERGGGAFISRWNAKENKFDIPISKKERYAILRFHVHFMVLQALKQIRNDNMKDVDLYGEMVGKIADEATAFSYGEAEIKYFTGSYEALLNAISEANSGLPGRRKKAK